jgi:lipopolysaccharide cholinephosphotransferase
MLREDYEVFLRHGQKYLPESFFLQSFHSDPEFPANFAKIRDVNTTFVEYSMKDRQINHGVYIDVFPLDYYPDKGQKVFFLKNLMMKLRMTDAFTPGNMKRKTKALRCVSRILYPSIMGAVEKREKLFKSISEGKRIANHCGAWGKREIVPKEWYGDGVQLMFEGMTVRGPSNYQGWLTQVYGNYMQLPPKEKQVAHHYVEAFDLHNSYNCYTERK